MIKQTAKLIILILAFTLFFCINVSIIKASSMDVESSTIMDEQSEEDNTTTSVAIEWHEYYTTARLNVRTAATTEASIWTTLNFGDKINVRNYNEEWS